MSSPNPDRNPYDLIGGEPVVRALVERFYDLMELEPSYRAPARRPRLEPGGRAREALLFLSGWLGGPSLYTDRFGHPMLRARHLPFAIGEVERDQWMACMRQAMEETEVSAELRRQLEAAFFKTADWMQKSAS